jgi:hypothetical protein
MEGHLSQCRFRKLEGLTITLQPNGEMVLAGPMPDQSALFGLLNWLHNLGAPLVSVGRLSQAHEEQP